MLAFVVEKGESTRHTVKYHQIHSTFISITTYHDYVIFASLYHDFYLDFREPRILVQQIIFRWREGWEGALGGVSGGDAGLEPSEPL